MDSHREIVTNPDFEGRSEQPVPAFISANPLSRWIVAEDYAELSSRSAHLLCDHLNKIILEKGEARVIPSAGKTPLGMFDVLRTSYSKCVPWHLVSLFQMDEYVEHSPSNPQSFAFFLNERLVKPLGIKSLRTINDRHGKVNGTLDSYQEELLSNGGIDLAIHGIGRNGHIGFNEPGSSWDSSTRLVRLADSTISANFGQGVMTTTPVMALTVGLKVLASVRVSMLLIAGEGKRSAALRLSNEVPGPELPASCLMLNRQVDVLIDRSCFHGKVQDA
jgi:glucosamine-6-phosphate deaminase